VLVRGTAGLSDFTDEAARDQRVLGVAGRVGYDLDPTIDYPRQFIGHVSIRLRDGRVLEERQDHPRGGPDFPLDRRDLETKFRGNARLALAQDAVERILEEAGRLATLPHVGPFMRRLNERTPS
jgi:2-methylcitrate dehydratase PrpD